MKKKPIRVTSIMKERIRAEMKRNHQTDQDMADMLYITRQQYSRIINGKYQLAPEHLKKLLSTWGVRENYLLGIDSVRSDEEMWNAKDESRSALIRSEDEFLKALGIKTEWCELVHFKISELIRLRKSGLDIDKMILFIDSYICEPRENWIRFMELLYEPYDNHDYYFLTSGLLIEDLTELIMEEEPGSDLELYEKIYEYAFYTSKIEIDGVLIGYCSSDFYNIIADTVKSLFSSLMNAKMNSREFIHYVDNSVEMMEKQEAERNEPLPFE